LFLSVSSHCGDRFGLLPFSSTSLAHQVPCGVSFL
jgi:hypothetical protein